MEPVRRRLLFAAACAAAAPICRTAAAAAAPKRVVLVDDPALFESEIRVAIIAGLWRHGFVAGRDYSLEFVDVGGRDFEIDRVARQVADGKPDVIVVGSTVRTTSFMKATRSIPIVFFNVADPVGAGFVASLARPGGNLTGVANLGFELAIKEYETLAELVPRARDIAVLSLAHDIQHARTVSEIEGAARSRGGPRVIGVVVPRSASSSEIAQSVARSRAGGVIFRFGRGDDGKDVFDLLSRAGIGCSVEHYDVARGGLLSIGENLHDRLSRTIDVVARIVRGEHPASIPVDQISKIRFAINLRTARAIGITVPAAVLARADEVIA